MRKKKIASKAMALLLAMVMTFASLGMLTVYAETDTPSFGYGTYAPEPEYPSEEEVVLTYTAWQQIVTLGISVQVSDDASNIAPPPILS